MKKILVCASRVSHILNFHLPYLRYFKEQGYLVEAAAEGTTDHPCIDRCYDLSFVKNPLSLQNWRTVGQLKQLLEENRYAMIYSNSTLSGAALKLAFLRMKPPKPYFVHISHGYMFSERGGMSSFVYRTVEKLTAKAPDALVVMNQEDRLLAEKYHLGKTLHYIYGMGLCGEKFPMLSEERRLSERNRFGVSPDGKLLLCVGEFSQRKNQALLIRAFDRIHRQFPDTVLVFAGNGNALGDCQRLVESLEQQDRIRFAGQVKDMNRLYRSADLLLSASRMEGLPFNVMEALYCGVPVLASAIKGHKDLIRNGQNGILFPLDGKDPVADAAAALCQLLSDPAYFEKLKANAFLEQKYLIGNVKPALLTVLDRDFSETVHSDSMEGAYE